MTTNNLRLFPILTVMSIFGAALLGGCSGEVGSGRDVPEAPPETASNDVGAPGEQLLDKSGRSYVQWCNKPNSSDGTICIQTGCTPGSIDCYYQESLAIAECKSEVKTVCGSPVQNWYIVMAWDGFHWALP